MYCDSAPNVIYITRRYLYSKNTDLYNAGNIEIKHDLLAEFSAIGGVIGSSEVPLSIRW